MSEGSSSSARSHRSAERKNRRAQRRGEETFRFAFNPLLTFEFALDNVFSFATTRDVIQRRVMCEEGSGKEDDTFDEVGTENECNSRNCATNSTLVKRSSHYSESSHMIQEEARREGKVTGTQTKEERRIITDGFEFFDATMSKSPPARARASPDSIRLDAKRV